MNLLEISDYIWLNSHEIAFGESDVWDESLFTMNFLSGKPIQEVWQQSKAGWYWFLVDMHPHRFLNIEKPTKLPKNGCNFGKQSTDNIKTFGEDLTYSKKDGMTVIYNGHSKNIKQRIRSHFLLCNDKTGALGIRHYPLSKSKWIVRFYSDACISSFSEDHTNRIRMLINSYSGRCAIESAWRARNGWPLLCKE